MRTDREIYIYTATSTTMAFALFGGVLGHYADRLAQLATTDSLTGLVNARAFNERLHTRSWDARLDIKIRCLSDC